MPDRIPMQHPPHPRQLPPRPTHRLLQNTRDFRLDAGEVGSSLLEMVLDSLQLAAGLVDELLDVADVPGDGVQGGVVGAVTGEVVEAGQLYSAGALQLLALSDVFEADQLLEALQVAGHWLLQPPGQHITPILGSPVHGGILPEVCTALQPDLIAQAYASPHILLFRVGLFDVALELCFRLVAQTEAHFVTERGTLYAVASRTEQVEARRVFRFAAQWLGGQQGHNLAIILIMNRMEGVGRVGGRLEGKGGIQWLWTYKNTYKVHIRQIEVGQFRAGILENALATV